MINVNKKTIFWDIGNVLIQGVHKPLFDDLLHNHKGQLTKEQLQSKFSEIIDDSFYGRISLEQTWDRLQQSFKIEDNQFYIIMNTVKKNNFNQELVAKLCEAGDKYNLGVISDLSQIGYDVVRENIGKFLKICKKDLVFISTKSSLTKQKEGSKLFSIITNKIDLSPENTLFIDDNFKNIELAVSFGMVGIQYERNENETSWDSNKILYNKLQKQGVNI